MQESLLRLEKAVSDRAATDKPLINWWLYCPLLLWLLVGTYPVQMVLEDSGIASASRETWWRYLPVMLWVTLGVLAYSNVLYYQRIRRRNRHFARVSDVFTALLECTREAAQARGVDVQAELADLTGKLHRAEGSLLKRRGAALWVILTLATLGIAGLYPLYFLTVDWYRLQRWEREMLGDFNRLWARIGITDGPVEVTPTVPKRSFWLYLALSVLTLGFWFLVWDHHIHTDPDRAFEENARWESAVLERFKRWAL